MILEKDSRYASSLYYTLGQDANPLLLLLALLPSLASLYDTARYFRRGAFVILLYQIRLRPDLSLGCSQAVFWRPVAEDALRVLDDPVDRPLPALRVKNCVPHLRVVVVWWLRWLQRR